jgi:hypothetical protein
VAYTLAITNTGLITDSFNVAVSPGSAFINTVEPATISNLVPQASALVTLTVTLPLAASPGTRETATVTVTSSGDPTQQATALISTTVAYMLRLLLVMR